MRRDEAAFEAVPLPNLRAISRVVTARLGRVALIALIVSAVPLLSACGDGESQSGGSEPIRVGTTQGITTLDPHNAVFAAEFATFGALWTTLVQYDKDNGADLQPGLAKSWDVSADQRTYTFKLRADARFSNGQRITSRDVVGSIKRILASAQKFPLKTLVPEVQRAAAVDSTTVKVSLVNKSAGQFLESLAFIPILDMSELSAFKGGTPPTSGPFKVQDFQPDDHLTIVRNERYWGEPAPARELRFVRASDPSAAVTSLQAGDFDALWSVPWANVKQLEDKDMSIVLSALPGVVWYFEVDDTSPPFDDLKAREALLHATDKEKINDLAFAGKLEIATRNTPVPPTDEYYNSSLPEYEFDLEKAKQLFAQAGVREGAKLRIGAIAGAFPEIRQAAQILQSDLAKIGIEAEVVTKEPTAYVQMKSPSVKHWPWLVLPGGLTTPAPYMLNRWLPGGFCGCNYDSAQYKAAVEQADREASDEGRGDLYREAQRIFSKDVPVPILGTTSIPTAVRPDIEGVWEDSASFTHFEAAHRRSP